MHIKLTGFVLTFADFKVYSKKINLKSEYHMNIRNKTRQLNKNLLKEKINNNQENQITGQELENETVNTSISTTQNYDLISFWKEILEEIKMIEWPSVDRLFKQFVIVTGYN